VTTEETLFIKNGTIVTMGEQNRVLKGSVLMEGGRIAAVGDVKTTADKVVDATGKLVIPGIPCGHSHMYGVFSRGMALKSEPATDFKEILERLWWMLDKGLTLKDVRLSAEVCLCEAIRCGTTSFAEHHASPNAVIGSLQTIADAVDRAGLRGLLCYETSDRDGEDIARQGIEENRAFAASYRDHPRIRGNFGLHASLTLSDETLARCVEAEGPLGCGFHVHVAEGQCDVDDAKEKYDMGVVERLHDRGISGPRSIFVHCVHASDAEKDLLASTKTHVAHNPESNMNNAVGVADVQGMLDRGVNVGLGTDGFTFNMFREAKSAYVVHKLATRDPRSMGADTVMDLLFRRNAAILDMPVGEVAPGKCADAVILDYDPPTRLNGGNFPWHFMFGLEDYQVRTVIADGKVVMEDRIINTLNEARIMAEAREASAALWDRL
jgi:putative selenium metabolism protein SsnA